MSFGSAVGSVGLHAEHRAGLHPIPRYFSATGHHWLSEVSSQRLRPTALRPQVVVLAGVLSVDADVTQILSQLTAGDESAADRLMPVIYAELRGRAELVMRGQGAQTLQPTALVHEAWMRLAGHDSSDYENRRHFIAVAAKVMRQILVDRARRRLAQKRGGGAEAAEISIESIRNDGDGPDSALEVLDLQEALCQLEEEHPRCAKIAELRFFGGLEVAEVAEVLGASESTIYKDWRFARAWLRRVVGDHDG